MYCLLKIVSYVSWIMIICRIKLYGGNTVGRWNWKQNQYLAVFNFIWLGAQYRPTMPHRHGISLYEIHCPASIFDKILTKGWNENFHNDFQGINVKSGSRSLWGKLFKNCFVIYCHLVDEKWFKSYEGYFQEPEEKIF